MMFFDRFISYTFWRNDLLGKKYPILEKKRRDFILSMEIELVFC